MEKRSKTYGFQSSRTKESEEILTFSISSGLGGLILVFYFILFLNSPNYLLGLLFCDFYSLFKIFQNTEKFHLWVAISFSRGSS